MKIILPIPKFFLPILNAAPRRFPGIRFLRDSSDVKAQYAAVRDLAFHVYLYTLPLALLLLLGGLLFWNSVLALCGWYVLAATCVAAAGLELHLGFLTLYAEWFDNGRAAL